MKTKQFLSATLVIVALMASCKKDDYRKLPSTEGIQFTSKIEGNAATKASGTTWGANDEIGVFMKQGSGLGNALAANKKYVTPGNGNFTATGADVINYPDQGKVDFIAYYPYASAVSGTTLPINVSNQTAQEKIDVMYSSNATGLDKTSGNPALTFTHKLSKIEIALRAGNGVDNLTGLTAVYNAINTVSSLDLASGNVAAGSTVANVNAKVIAGANVVVEAILIPGDYSGKEVVFTVGGENFKWTLPSTQYETGRKYNYTVELQSGETGPAVAVEGTGTITDWNAVSGGSFNINKENGGNTTEPETGTDPEPEGVEQTIFNEGFGEIEQGISTKYRFGTYAGFNEKGVFYSDLYNDSYADIRRTNTMPAHSWLPAGKTTGFKIDGINSDKATDLVLTYSLAANGSGAPVNGITVRINGTVYPVSGTLGGQNVFSEQTITGIAPASTMTIEFEGTAANNTVGYRVDNIKLVGKK